ncbi:MAG: nucleoside permease [Roseibacillus sp.]|nr:nucleoside permease [Roseibacillus sp.]
MFIQYFFWGAWYVSAYPYLSNKVGFEAGALGWTYSMAPLAAMISPFFVGMIADRFFSTQNVLGILHILGGALLWAAGAYTLGENPDPWTFNGLLLAHFLCFMPTLGLSNTLCFHKMDNPEKQFPWIRVAGTIGWIAGGFLITLAALDATGVIRESAVWMFKLGAISGVILGLYCFTMPNTPPASAGKKVTAREVFCIDAFQLMGNPSFSIFMICSFIICIPLSFYYAFAAACLADVGVEGVTLKMTFGQISEIFFMVLMPLFFARLGVKKMLLVGMLAWAARYALFAFGAADPASPVTSMLLAGVILHGICYDFFFVTGQIYVDKAAPKEIRGSAQGLLVLVTLGAGMFIGAIVAGWIKGAYTSDDGFDWQPIWMWPAGMAAVVFVLFGLLFRDPPKEDDTAGEASDDEPGGAGEPSSEGDEPETTGPETGTEEAGEDEAPPVMPIEGE